MTTISANKIFKSVQLVLFIFLVFLCVDCFGSFLSLKSSIESQENLLKLPIQNKLNGLDYSDLTRLRLGSRPPSTPGKLPIAEFPKTSKFDLNELPEENDSYLGNGIFEKENEKELHQASKKQRMEVVNVPINQGLIKHSSSNLKTFESIKTGPASSLKNFIQGIGIVPSQILTANINTVDIFGHRLLSKNQPSSSKSVPIKIINLPSFKSVLSIKINQPKKRARNDIISEKKPNALVDWESKINSLEPKQANDSEEGKIYQSPYNRDLLSFLKKNLNQIMPKELKNYRFTSDFVEGIERFYWNNKLSAFILVEETIPVVMLLGDSWSHRRKGLTWLEYTSKDVETPNLHDASVMFKFRTVFQNLYRFENLSSPFFNDPMRLKSVDYLKRLEGTLSTIQRDMNKRITSYSSIIDRIFSSLPGYLVCIHGLNEIIRPSSSMHERPVVQQEQALEFFIELNSELAESYRNLLQRKVNLVMSDVRWVDLEFKERKRQLSYKVVNSIQVQPDYLAWVYVELWLITHRPNFYKFYADLACAEESRKISKFKSSFNKLLFILFSGVVKSQQH